MHRSVPLIFLLTFLAALTGAVTSTARPATPATTPALERVTLIGDSIAAAMEQEQAARAILAGGIELDTEVAVCRRLVGESCPYEGARPPTLVALLPTLRLGSTVIVAVGYNDPEEV